MIVMVTSDFYMDYELYKTDDPEGLENIIKTAYLTETDPEIDRDKYQVIGNQDDIISEVALNMSDKVIYLSDIEDEAEADSAGDHDGEAPDLKRIILKALDEIEELRQQDAELRGDLDYECRVAAANIAELAGFDSRAAWTEALKNDPESKYHKRYFNGVYHV